jgi:DNA-directed RNA polymerase specialized sigma24 family protein
MDFVDVAASDGVMEALESSECGRRLGKALGQVTPMHRRVLIDHLIHGHSVKQIAKRRRIPVGTVLSRIFAAKRVLRTEWEALP